MGKQDVKSKVVSPAEIVRALQSGSITTAQAQQMFNGVMPIGDYKGIASVFDLDKLVNQPSILAEQQHVLGILSGREEDYDLQTVDVVLAEVIGTAHVAQLTVPDDELWFVQAIETTVPASGGVSQYGTNWFCSLWTDRVGALGYGQPFWGAEQLSAVGGSNWFDEFGVAPNVFAVSNKQPVLRAPAGTVFTFIVTTRTLACDLALNVTFQVWGYRGKPLVA